MRALISILLLLGAAGAIFVAGWIQILLPPATYGVLFSKTGGFDPRVMAPGVFVWRWERVIPNNVTLFLFEVQPHTIETRLSGELPSAEAVASMLPGTAGAADFRYQATVSVTFAVRPEALPELVSGAGLTPEDLNHWTEVQGTAMGRAALEWLQRRAQATALTDPGCAGSGDSRPRWLPDFRSCRCWASASAISTCLTSRSTNAADAPTWS